MLRLVAVTLVAAVIAGRLAGGRLRNLAAVRVAALPLTFASAGLVVVARFAGGAVGTGLQLAAVATTGTFLAVNATRFKGWLRAGLAVIAVGWTLNALVIAANAGMPLSLPAYAASGQTDSPTPGEAGFFAITIADETTVFRPLGDVIPLAPLRAVVSPGDLLLALGIIVLIGAGMRDRAGDGSPSASMPPNAPAARELREAHEHS